MGLADENTAEEAKGWRGGLRLHYTRAGARTVLSRREQHGPLHLQRSFYPEGPEVAHSYLLHPPGGVVGGDTLTIEADIESGAHALLTTPAAGKFYRCDGRSARMQQRLRVHADAALEWLPQETIVYSGAEAQSITRVELDQGASFIGWEMICLGRPAAGEAFDHGLLRQRFEIWRDDRPLWLERARYAGASDILRTRWGLSGKPLCATLVAVGAHESLVEEIRRQVDSGPDEAFSVTQLDEVLVCRYLGDRAQRARACLSKAWRILRPECVGRIACEPRVWHT